VLARDQPRAALAAVLPGRRGPFTVVAVHLSFAPGWNAGQLLALRRWVADLPRPHVVLGDLNMVGALPALSLRGAELAGTAARRAAPPSSPAAGRPAHRWRDLARTPTYPAHRPVVQFDHVIAVGVPRGAVLAHRAPRTGISDHRPLIVDVAL
jgi:endonuclease/exonuclease/phosphatase family metal-dependent hydrolase